MRSNQELGKRPIRGRRRPLKNGHVACVGKFKGVVNEILEDVFEFSPVAVERWKARRKLPMEPYIFGQRVLLKQQANDLRLVNQVKDEFLRRIESGSARGHLR